MIERDDYFFCKVFIGLLWRDCVGIEPTGDGTRLPQGFEDPGGHQSPIQPH